MTRSYFRQTFESFKVAKWRLTSNLAVQAQMDCCVLESEIHALECMPTEAQKKLSEFILFVLFSPTD